MSGQVTGETLRQRTRRLVRDELIDVAVGLFAEQGYEAVTVDQIAEAAGMSRRSFFRYFASKDALVLGKFDRVGGEFAGALAARPAGEPAWTALRGMFDPVVVYATDPELTARGAEVARIIDSTPELRAGFIERMQRSQQLVVDVLVEREVAGGSTRVGRPEATALVAAAFAALTSARQTAHETGERLDVALDEAMAVIGEAGVPDGVREADAS